MHMGTQRLGKRIGLMVTMLAATSLLVVFLDRMDRGAEPTAKPVAQSAITRQAGGTDEIQAASNVSPISLQVQAVAGLGDTGFLALDGRVQAYEVSDSEAVTYRDRTARLWSSISSLETRGDTLFVAGRLSESPAVTTGSGDDALVMLDVSDPSDIQWAGSVSSPGRIADLEIAGDVMLAANEDTGAEVYDLASAAGLSPVAALSVPNGGARRVLLGGDLAYVLADDSMLMTPTPSGSSGGGSTSTVGPRVMLWDVSAIDSPILLSSIGLESVDAAMHAVGDYLYIALRNSLKTYNIHSPTAPVLLSTVALYGHRPTDVLHDGGKLFISMELDAGEATNSMIRVFDLATPTNPDEIAEHYVEDTRDVLSAIGMEWAGGRLLVATTEGLEVARWVESNELIVVSPPRLSRGWLSSVVVVQDTAFVADEFQGLRVFDIQDPADPMQIGRETTAGIVDVVKQGDYVFATSDYELFVYDVHKAVSPRLVTRLATVETDGYGMNLGLAVYEDWLFISGHERGIAVYDISAPDSPIAMESLDISDHETHALMVDDHYLFAGNTSHLVTYDLAGPTGPELLGEFEHGGGIVSIVAMGDYVVTSDLAYGFQVFDVSDPSNVTLMVKRLMGSGQTAGGVEAISTFPNAMAVLGGFVLSATYGTHDPVRVVDMTNPGNPTETGSYTFAGGGRDIALAGTGTEAVVSFGDVMGILDISNPNSPTLIGALNVEG